MAPRKNSKAITVECRQAHFRSATVPAVSFAAGVLGRQRCFWGRDGGGNDLRVFEASLANYAMVTQACSTHSAMQGIEGDVPIFVAGNLKRPCQGQCCT